MCFMPSKRTPQRSSERSWSTARLILLTVVPTAFDPANRACPASLSLQASDVAQQNVLVQQGVDSSPPNPGSDSSSDIRSIPSPVLRLSCRSVYHVAPPLLYPGEPALSENRKFSQNFSENIKNSEKI